MELHNDFYQFGKVELELNDNESIPAFILDLNIDENGYTKINLNFENNALPDAEYETTKIRLPLKVTENEIQQMKEGDQIEICATIDDSKRWIKAKIAFIQNEIFGVSISNEELKSKISKSKSSQFKFNDELIDLLVAKSDVRPLNKSSKIISNPFFKKEVKSSEIESLEDLSFLNDQNVHQLFKKKINAILVKYNSIKKCLTIIYYIENSNSLSQLENMNHRIDIFANLHMKLLKYRGLIQMNLNHSIERFNQAKLDRELEEIKFEDDLYRLEMIVPTIAIGLCFGKAGNNMNNAKKIEGVKDVKFDNSKSMFVITASTKEACLRASKLLSFSEKSISIPRNIIGKILGKNSSTIQQICDDAPLIDDDYFKIIFSDGKDGKDGKSFYVKFHIVGARESVDNALELLKYYMASLYDIDKIRIKKEEILNDLKEIEIYYPRKGQFRSNNFNRYPNYNNYGRFTQNSNANRYVKKPLPKQIEKQQDPSKSGDLVTNSTSKPLNENITTNSSQSNTIESNIVQSNTLRHRGNHASNKFRNKKRHDLPRSNRYHYKMNYNNSFPMNRRPMNQDYCNRMVST